MVEREQVSAYIELSGILLMFGLSLFAALVWWSAYLNGGTVLVDIDAIGELWFELLLWLVVIPLITLSLYSYLNGSPNIARQEKKDS